MNDDQNTGLILSIYSLGGQADHVNGGTSPQINTITVTSAHIRGKDKPSKAAPEFHLWAFIRGGIGPSGVAWVSADDLPLHELQENNTHLFLVPAGERPYTVKHENIFAYAPDDQFAAICKYPIPLHTELSRVERQRSTRK
jgi:hypothetical protein